MSSSGNWQPKALVTKEGRWRRGSEFNVAPREPGAAAAPAPALSKSKATLVPPNPSWGKPAASGAAAWAADLDDLPGEDDSKPLAKRPRSEQPAAGSSSRNAAAAPASAPTKANAKPSAPAASAPAADRDEVLEGSPRLAQHIASASKCVKVAAMAFALLEGERVTMLNAGAFFQVLEAAMLNPRRLREKEMRVAYRKLFTAACNREHLFPQQKRPMLELWRVRVLLQLELYTDDTFQFSRAVRQVREWLEKLPCIYPALEPKDAKHLPEHERAPWIETVFDCSEVAMQHHKYPWAKTAVDMLVRACIDRRQNFSEEQQRTLQEWNAVCKGQKIQRQQAHAQARKEQTAYERKEAEWQAAAITIAKGGGDVGGGIDNWMAKQSNN